MGARTYQVVAIPPAVMSGLVLALAQLDETALFVAIPLGVMSGPKVKSHVGTGVGGSAGPVFAADRRLCRSVGQEVQLSGSHCSLATVVYLPYTAASS